MRHRWGIALAFGLLILAAGCLGQPSDRSPEEGTPATDPEGAAPSSNANGDGSSDADGPASSADRANRSQPRPLGELTMEGADRTRPNATTVVFTWNATLPPGASTTEAAFELPTGTPFTTDVHLAWAGTNPLGLRLASPNTTFLCRSVAAIPAEGDQHCSTTSVPRAGAGTWSVQVVRAAYDNVGPAASDRGPVVPFTVTVELRSLAPEGVPTVPALIDTPSAEADRFDPGWPEPGKAPIRPGIKIDGAACTANFIFATPSNGTLFIGTAAHCFPGDALGDEVPIGAFTFNGTLAYCSWGAQERVTICPQKAWSEDPGYEDDFALVRLPPSARDKVHPATLVWGGPIDVTAPPDPGGRLLTYGNSEARDLFAGVNALDSRPGVVLERGDASTLARFVNPVVRGDSGGPVLTQDGAATGVLSYIDIGGERPTGQTGVAHLDHALEQLEANTDRAVELATWPTFEPPKQEIRETGSPLPDPSIEPG